MRRTQIDRFVERKRGQQGCPLINQLYEFDVSVARANAAPYSDFCNNPTARLDLIKDTRNEYWTNSLSDLKVSH
jgi:hypothetical protein